MKRPILFILTVLFFGTTLSTNAETKLILREPSPILAQKLQTSFSPAPTRVASLLCPDDMIEIDSEYCPNIQQECLQWVDARGNNTEAPPPGMTGRCGIWKKPSVCLGSTVHKHYCIDKYEYPNKKDQVPQDWMSWYDVLHGCDSVGKRMCTRSEWTLAAEGPNMHPYPYGDGFHRDRVSCNTDNPFPELNGKSIDVFKATSPNTPEGKVLRSLLVPAGAKPNCISDWGVYDMPGNIDEWVINESATPYVSGLMGGHVFGVRNASRPMTEAHGPSFSWYETGGRCCKDAK